MEWRWVVGLEGKYKVSEDGQVRGVARASRNGRGVCYLKERLLKPRRDHDGYLRVRFGLGAKGSRKVVSVHRVVASAFVEREVGKDFVDHIDRVRVNNSAGNLRWVTFEENMANRIRFTCKHCRREN